MLDFNRKTRNLRHRPFYCLQFPLKKIWRKILLRKIITSHFSQKYIICLELFGLLQKSTRFIKPEKVPFEMRKHPYKCSAFYKHLSPPSITSNHGSKPVDRGLMRTHIQGSGLHKQIDPSPLSG